MRNWFRKRDKVTRLERGATNSDVRSTMRSLPKAAIISDIDVEDAVYAPKSASLQQQRYEQLPGQVLGEQHSSHASSYEGASDYQIRQMFPLQTMGQASISYFPHTNASVKEYIRHSSHSSDLPMPMMSPVDASTTASLITQLAPFRATGRYDFPASAVYRASVSPSQAVQIAQALESDKEDYTGCVLPNQNVFDLLPPPLELPSPVLAQDDSTRMLQPHQLPKFTIDPDLPELSQKPVLEQQDVVDVSKLNRIIYYIRIQMKDALETALQAIDTARYLNTRSKGTGISSTMYAAEVGDVGILELLKEKGAKFFGHDYSLYYKEDDKDCYSRWCEVAQRDGHIVAKTVFAFLENISKQSFTFGVSIFGPLQFSALAGKSEAFMFILKQAPSPADLRYFHMWNLDIPDNLFHGLDCQTLGDIIVGKIGGVDVEKYDLRNMLIGKMPKIISDHRVIYIGLCKTCPMSLAELELSGKVIFISSLVTSTILRQQGKVDGITPVSINIGDNQELRAIFIKTPITDQIQQSYQSLVNFAKEGLGISRLA